MSAFTLDHVYEDGRTYRLGVFPTYADAFRKAVAHWQIVMRSPSGGCASTRPSPRVKILRYEPKAKDYYKITYHPHIRGERGGHI